MDSISDSLKNVGDAGAGAITIGAIINWIPEVTAILSLIWVIIRIYETKTFQQIKIGQKRKVKKTTPIIKPRQRGKK
jgi:hypothetical protein